MIIKFFKILVIVTAYFLSSCKLNRIENIHGIQDLRNHAKNLKKEINNQNDVINLIGNPHLIDFKDKNIWIYYEIVETKNLYGEKKILKNDVILLEFNKKGILLEKKIFTKEQMNKIEFSENFTESKGINASLIKDLLASSKKRMEKLYKK